jgi:SAM-dependent methyltransferase
MDRLIAATARAERDHFWFRGFRAFVRPLLARATPARRPLRVLDCGCGTGNNLALLEPLGAAFGIDLTWSALTYARESGKTRIARASAARLPFPDASFDLVTSFDVFQCLSDADEPAAAAEIQRVLRPGGHALLNVAAMDLLWGDHSILAHEVRRYSRARLRDILAGAGFDILRLTYTNMSLFPVLYLVRFVQRLRGLPASDDVEGATREITIPPAPLNALFSGVLLIEAALARRINLPFGSSIICLARKPERATPTAG